MISPRFPHHHHIPTHAKCVFSGVRSEVYQWDQEMYDGSIARFERVRFLDGAFVLAILPSGNILMTRQEQPSRKPFISLPGGALDPEDLSPEAGARRELLEETGYASDTLIPWIRYDGSSNVMTYAHIFIARDCYHTGEIQEDPGEKIELYEVTFDELLLLSSDIAFQQHMQLISILYEARLFPEKKAALYETLYGKKMDI